MDRESHYLQDPIWPGRRHAAAGADLTPSISGRSPGALTSEYLMRLRTCVTERTVAATNHGRPTSEQTMMSSARTNRSRWYPKPFCMHDSTCTKFTHNKQPPRRRTCNTSSYRRSQHSQECHDPGRQCFCASWPWHLTFQPKNKWVFRTHRVTFLCHVWWSQLHRFLRYLRKSRQTDT